MLSQFRLLQASKKLKTGQAVRIPFGIMEEAVQEECEGSDLIRHLSELEVCDFSQKIAENWSVRVRYNHVGQMFTMYK